MPCETKTESLGRYLLEPPGLGYNPSILNHPIVNTTALYQHQVVR